MIKRICAVFTIMMAVSLPMTAMAGKTVAAGAVTTTDSFIAKLAAGISAQGASANVIASVRDIITRFGAPTVNGTTTITVITAQGNMVLSISADGSLTFTPTDA